jgi:hypothetical protein
MFPMRSDERAGEGFRGGIKLDPTVKTHPPPFHPPFEFRRKRVFANKRDIDNDGKKATKISGIPFYGLDKIDALYMVFLLT